MKIRIALVFIIFSFQKSFTQTVEWNTYDLDSIVSLDMPFDVYETDSISEYQKVKELFSEHKSAKFIVKKVYAGKRYNNIETPTLPRNLKTLNKFYTDLIDIFDVIIKNDFDYQKKIKKNNLHGYEVSYKNRKGKKVHQIQLFYANKNLYTFTYQDSLGLKEDYKDSFFDSIYFDEEKELLQYPDKPFEKKLIIGLFIVLFLSFLYKFKS